MKRTVAEVAAEIQTKIGRRRPQFYQDMLDAGMSYEERQIALHHPGYVLSEDACPVCKGAGWTNYTVDVLDPRHGLPQRCDCQVERLKARLFSEADVPPIFAGCTLETFPWGFDADATKIALFDWIVTLATTGHGMLLLHGSVGVGKTGLAIGILRAYTEKLKGGKFVTATDFLLRLRDAQRKDAPLPYTTVMDMVRTAPFLVMDDIGKERVTGTGFTEDAMFSVVDHRYSHQLPTVYTSNMPPKDLATHLGIATVSRITGDASLVLGLTGMNLRARR